MQPWVQCLGTQLLPVALLLSPLFPAPHGSQLQVTTAPSSTARVGLGTLLQCQFDVGEPVALDSLQVTWYFLGRMVAWYNRSRGQDQPRASLPLEKELESGNASLSLAMVTVPDGGLYRCVVGYRAQHHEGNTTLHLLADPKISIPKESAIAHVETSLLCHVGGFFPKHVDVAWLRDGQVLKGSTRSSPQRNPDGTFNLTLTYTFTPTRSDAGSNFSCRVHHAALGHPLQKDISLHILGAPTISIQKQAAVANAEMSLLCHVGGFLPKDMDVAWLRDGQVLKGSTRSSPQRNQDETFNLTLTYTFSPAHSDTSSVFSCRIHHVALGQTLQEEDVLLIILEEYRMCITVGAALGVLGILIGVAVALGIYCCRNRKKGWVVSYNVSKVEGPEQCLLGQEVTLRCSMEGTFPKDVDVTWERIHSKDRTVPESAGDQESPKHQPLFPALPPGWRVTEERAGTRLTSSLTFTPTLQDDGVQIRCIFLHKAKRIREERVSPEIQVWARPQVSEIQVLPEWDPHDKVPFAVQLHNFYPMEVPPIQWGWDGAGSWREDPAQIDKNADGTFTATSVWRVPSRSLTQPELRVRVCVQHGPGEPASERELSLRAAGLLRPPDVSEISQPESMPTGKGVTLSCRIAGHFPGELSVTWLRRGKGEATAVILRDSAECRVEPGTAVLARDGKSFQQETRLTRWTSQDKGAEYICRVGHLTLETPIERSSGHTVTTKASKS
ncbi:tyrosine-protein phosphatase non-receptor type substrate 1 isoform X2 [Alligator mississippiensis]|uniref:tyrosine-protein phosphatase non-receptor type substrate 1 isoform X2 n=1 Tax=Alligator mississippiensis TaxID=8496 RepID=UPI002877BBAF|nr:tyrosine-protein phosphatase non-receptor type substrate 1 isoform X2 [Alligator mississippiensis]